MTRRSINIPVTLSLAWLLGLALLWAVSHARTGVASAPAGGARYFLSSHAGRVTVGVQSITPPVAGPGYAIDVATYGSLRITQDGNTATATSFDPHYVQKKFAGFGKSRWRGIFTVGGTTYNAEARIYAAPWWAVALTFGAPATVPLLRWRRVRAWRRAGKCAACGYDLRAGGDRCPECGTPAETAFRRLRRLVVALLFPAPAGSTRPAAATVT